MVDVKLAVRTLAKSPFVTIVAVVSLAFGIGANAAIFSMLNQILLRPLPVPEPERLVNLSAPGPKSGSTQCNQAGSCDEVFSYAMFRDLEGVQTVFTGIAAHRLFSANLAYAGQTANGEGLVVSGSYFPVLGLKPALGRLIGPEDDRVVGESPVVVLSHGYWQTRFASDPSVIDQTMIVNGRTLTIVGVAPRGFSGTTLGANPQVFVPITLRGFMQPGFVGFPNRRGYWAYLFARLRPGVSIEQARASLDTQYREILVDVEAPLQQDMSEQTLARFKAKPILIDPGARGQSSVSGESKAPLSLLFGVTALVLAIACANVANLLMVRSAARAGEMAVRLSIGASRWQLIAQLLTESSLLALGGGVGGLLVANGTLALMYSLLPPEAASSLQFTVDVPVLLFAASLALGTGVLFGLFPALNSTRPDLASTLKGQSGQPSGARSAARFRSSLATVQIALSMALLVSAGLFTKSLLNVSRVVLGLTAENVVTFGVSPELNGYTLERTRAFFERVEDDLLSAPGVTGVSASLVPLLAGSNWGNRVDVEGFQADSDTDTNSSYNAIGSGYFETLGVPLLSGREFTRADTAAQAKVAVVNEAFMRKFGLGRDAVGKRMGGNGGSGKLDLEIVGVVSNVKYSEVKRDVPPVFYTPYRQYDRLGYLTFYVRSAIAPGQLFTTIRTAVAKLDPDLPVDNVRTLPQQVRENVFLDRMMTTLSAAFASLATVLAAVGLYGVLAYTVSQRTREIGLRMALGAAPGRVRAMVLRQVGVMTAIGGAMGLVAAIWVGNAARALLFRLEAYDPAVVSASVAILAVVALGAGYVPAHRASRVRPMQALRYE